MKIIKRWWKWLIIAAALGLVWLALRNVDFHAVIAVLGDLSAGQLGVFLLLNAVILLLIAWRWGLILGALGYTLPLVKILAFRLTGFGVSYFTPGPQFGGEPVQVMLLQRQGGLPLAAAITSVFADKLVELTANFSFLVVGLVMAGLSGILGGQTGFATGAGVVLMGLPVIYWIALWRGGRPLSVVSSRLWARSSSPRLSGVSRTLHEIEEQTGLLAVNRPIWMLGVLAVTAAAWLLTLVEFRWVMAMLGASLDWEKAISLLAIVRIAFLLPMPGGLGALEAALLMAGPAVGVTPTAAAAAALLIRARDVSLGLIGLMIGGLAFNDEHMPTHDPSTL